MQTAREISRLDLSAIPPIAEETNNPSNIVGLLLDFEQLYYFNSLPQSRKWAQGDLLKTYYGAIARLGLKVQIIHPDRPWPPGLKLLVALGVQMIDADLVTRLIDSSPPAVIWC